MLEINLSSIINLLQSTLRMATPLIFAALGGVFSERSGVINIALEGIMLIGAFAAMLFSHLTGNPWIGVLAAIATGLIISYFHAVASIEFRANQVVSGTAINIFAAGIVVFLLKIIFSADVSPNVKTVRELSIPLIRDIPYLGNLIGKHVPFVYLAFIFVFLSYWVLWKTSFGLRIRAVGEHPEAADSVGINVKAIRYSAVLISGALAGIAGSSLSVGFIGLFEDGVISGRGFIALAAMIFGRWTPQGAMYAALLFGFAQALQMLAQTLGITFIPGSFLLMLPYVLTILALTGIVGTAKAPAADGEPYIKEQ
ncbi:MAG: ABC transporter permease [Halanaerobiales bacterium]